MVCARKVSFMAHRTKKFAIVATGIDRMLTTLCNIDTGRFSIEVLLSNSTRQLLVSVKVLKLVGNVKLFVRSSISPTRKGRCLSKADF